MDSAIRRAARELFQRSGIYKLTLSINTIEGESDYDIPFLEDVEIMQAETICFREVGTTNFLTGLSSELKFPNLTAPGKPRYAYFPSDKLVRFNPVPDGVYTYYTVLMVMNTLNATTIRDAMFNQWGETIAFGAARYLSLQKGKPWFDPDMAQVLRGEFNRGLVRACNMALTGYANEEARARGNGFI